MESLATLGIDPLQLIAQVVNFGIIAFLVQRFLLRPLLANLKTRREKIATGLQDAENARVALESAESERAKILAAARREASGILESAHGAAEEVRRQAETRARADADRLLDETRSLLAAEREQAEREVRSLSLELSGRILETVVRDLFDEEEKRRVVARGLERIARVGAT